MTVENSGFSIQNFTPKTKIAPIIKYKMGKRNACLKLFLNALKKGLNKITVSAREAGLVLERLVVYPKDMERDTSYLGEKECSRVTLSIEK